MAIGSGELIYSESIEFVCVFRDSAASVIYGQSL